MQKYLVFAYLVGSLAACRSTTSGPDGGSIDMAAPPGSDLSVQTDMARNYMPATIHDIDVNTNPTGPLKNGGAVKLTDVIATSDVRYFKSKTSTTPTCTYEVFVQDPACSTPPCGMVLEIDGPLVATTGPACPKAAMSNTVLAPVNVGDKLTVNGFVNVFQKAFGGTATIPDGGVTPTFTQHGLDLKDVQVTASGQTLPAPIVVADSSAFTYILGTGWQMYEGTRVTISNQTVASVDQYDNFKANPGNVPWGSAYDNNYRFAFDKDGGVFPLVGQHFSSITGIVSTLPALDGPQLLATAATDFVP